MSNFKKHLDAIRAGKITRSNIIGMRKAFNAYERKDRGYSVSVTASQMTFDEYDQATQAIGFHKPRVIGELHEGGLKVLRSKRYAKRLAPVADIIAGRLHFRLIGFEWLDNTHCVPVYQAIDGASGRSFKFRNVPWQSGGQGPEILS